MKLKNIVSALLLTICLSTLNSCKEDTKTKSSTLKQEIKFTKEGILKLKKADGSTIKEIEIEIADNDYERETGLMYRKTMLENRGMLFIMETEKPQNFYMKNTKIALDIIYINSKKEIVSISKNAAPLNEASLPSNYPAKYVLELNAGLSDKWEIAVGDTASW